MLDLAGPSPFLNSLEKIIAYGLDLSYVFEYNFFEGGLYL